MAENRWSDEQLSVINSRKENLLVSAAAGAGKTSVLVERIVRMITEPGSETDIDNLLIMTFTNAAAAEMKERLRNKMAELLQTEPDNKRLRRQQTLLHNAYIMTTDSFCLSVVREYFHVIDLDPAFRIGQEAELRLLGKDVMDRIVEARYEAGEDSFLEVVEAFGTSRSDEGMISYVRNIVSCALAHPYPGEWLDGLESELRGERRVEDREWMRFWMQFAERTIKEAVSDCEEALKYSRLSDGPSGYEKKLSLDLEYLRSIEAATDYTSLKKALEAGGFERLPGKPGANASEFMVGKVKLLIQTYKDIVTKLKETMNESLEEIGDDLSREAGPLLTLIDIAREYMAEFREAKKERNIIDFNDLEHFALDILTEKSEKTGERKPSKQALELRKRFKEIFVDEYQDSNRLQEEITDAIAGNSDSTHTFMVGDVKQSIYKFRMAKPELFMDRYADYSGESPKGRNIILNKNYRSRAEVLDSSNDVFFASMSDRLGGIEYDEDASLKVGKEAAEDGTAYKTRVVTVYGSGASGGGEEEQAGSDSDKEAEDSTEIEVKAVANVIRTILSENHMVETKSGLRKAEYGDIVILLRSVRTPIDAYTTLLSEEGIPVYSDASAGFLNSYEVKHVIDYIRILDNPRQDIPLVAVLHSPVIGLSGDELTEIRTATEMSYSYYEALTNYRENGENAELKEKVNSFFETYESIKGMNLNRDIARVIEAIYIKTGIYAYCTALSQGAKRASNLDRLLSYAAEYEESSYSGLFAFVRYIEQLIESELELDEAAGAEAGNAVRIMSIHKSKGLEFPFVIIGGMGRKIVNRDARHGVVVSPDFGLASDVFDSKRRIKYPTLHKGVTALRMTLDNLGEELRLLYVAMTRAKQQLYLVGSQKKRSKKEEVWEAVSKGTEKYSYSYLTSMGSYYDMVMPAAMRNPEHFEILSYDPEAIRDAENKEEAARNEKRRSYLEDNFDISSEEIMKILAYEYPYPEKEVLPIKMSVSELKHKSIEEEFGEEIFETPKDVYVSEKSPGVSGAERGTLYHKIMQLISFELVSGDEVRQFLASLVKRDIIGADEAKLIDPEKISEFLKTPEARRMAQAEKQGKLMREQPFVMGKKACEIDSEKYAGIEDLIPVQGVIDCMFEENGEFVILDYKTDYIEKGKGDELVRRYRTQLEYYAEAAETIMNCRVSQKIIYSFSLGEVINV